MKISDTHSDETFIRAFEVDLWLAIAKDNMKEPSPALDVSWRY